jgi:hypothetical protein
MASAVRAAALSLELVSTISVIREADEARIKGRIPQSGKEQAVVDV